MTDVPGLTETAEGSEPVGGAVVGEDSARRNTPLLEPPERPEQEGGRVQLPLIGQDLDVSQTGVVVYADVGKLPTDAPNALGAITVDAVPDPADPPQLLDI